MKKWTALLLVLILMLSVNSALAAGKVTIDQLNFREIDGLWHSVYGFAKVVNDGDEAVYLDNGIIQLWDENGGVIASDSYLSAGAACLQPGEYTYVEMSCTLEEGMPSPDTADMTIGGTADYYVANLRLPVQGRLALGVQEGWWEYNYMYAVVLNNTESILYDINVVLALLDAEGNILYMDDHALYSEVGVPPGGSIIIRKDISSSFMDYFSVKGITPAKVDAIAYVDVDVEN